MTNIPYYPRNFLLELCACIDTKKRHVYFVHVCNFKVL